MKKKLENIKQFIIKHDELFFCIMFLVMISGYALNIKTDVGDEVWNFQNIYKMYNGYKIYIDANVITTPLFHVIGLILFKLFGANFLIFRIYNILISILLFFITYKIFKKITYRKSKSLLFTIIIFALEKHIVDSTANYNMLANVFVLFGTYIILNKEKFKYYCFLESICIMLIILTKQNVGIFYIIGYFIYSIIYKNKFKENIKIVFYILIMTLLFILVLFGYNVLSGFISYCFLGIEEFAKNNVSTTFIGVIIMVVLASVNLYYIIYINYEKKLKKNQIKYINILSCFAFPLLLASYPIFNWHHILIAIYLQIVLILYIFTELIHIKDRKKLFIVISILIYAFFSVKSILYDIEYFKGILNSKYEYNNVFFGTLFDSDIEYKINNVKEYIERANENVIVLSSDAAIYMLPLNRSNGAMDLPLLGNFGRNGEDGIIEEISNMSNTKILLNKEKAFWQESDKIINYVKDNFECIGEIEDLLIYIKDK